jgi:hypothetical protein
MYTHKKGTKYAGMELRSDRESLTHTGNTSNEHMPLLAKPKLTQFGYISHLDTFSCVKNLESYNSLFYVKRFIRLFISHCQFQFPSLLCLDSIGLNLILYWVHCLHKASLPQLEHYII